MKGDSKIGKLFKARENTSVYGTNGFSFTSHHLIGKPNQDISELFSALNFKLHRPKKIGISVGRMIKKRYGHASDYQQRPVKIYL